MLTIDRPERMNSFRGRTVDELISAFKHAWADRRVAAVILTGAGDRAFCTGGDVKERAETGGYGETEWGTFEIERLHRIIRDIPKPVIAAVNGVAIGGGHVLHVLCDLSVAADNATFGQAGPRVGSFDAGFGSAYLARVVGEKRARQIWFLLDRFDATTAERWGLVNAVVPRTELLDRAGVGPPDGLLLADRAALPQALVQRRHRPHQRHLPPRLRRAGVVRRDAGGGRGRARVRGEAASRISSVSLSRGAVQALTCDHLVTYFRVVTDEDDRVFKALADPTRRFLLDRLFERDGRTLTELESELEMTRFGVMKHLRVLEDAGLVVTRRSGREKRHFLNPVPIRLIHDRWIDKYTERQVSALADLKKQLEEPS